MKSTVEYEFLDVIQAGEQFKISLVLDEYGNQAVSKAQINPEDEFATRHLGIQATFLRDSNHPSIVRFRDNTETELFMEAMAGALETQTANACKTVLCRREIVSFLRQMLTLLSHLDSHALTAGQLSPRTILCNEDFSIFKVAMAYPKDAAIPADPKEKIFPPEINSGENYDVHSSDIYCLGMTCIELALGAANFEAQFNGMYDNSSDLWIRWHENPHETLPELAEILDGFPIGLAEILQKMTAKSLDLRFDSAAEVLSELDKLGIVDGKVVVKQKRNMPTAAVASCIALIVVAMLCWNRFNTPAVTQESKPDVKVNQSTPVEFAITSNIQFDYKIGDAKFRKCSGAIRIDKSQKLWVKPDTKQKGWAVSVDGERFPCTKDGVEIDWKNSSGELTLNFERLVTISSKYKNYLWSLDRGVDGSFRGDEVVINDLEIKKIWIKAQDHHVKLENDVSSDGWSSVTISDENELDLNFVFPVQLELVGYKKLSSDLLGNRELNVRVGDQKLNFDGTKFFKADIPYTGKQKEGWKTTVEYAGEKLFNQKWSDFSTDSESRKIAKLYGKVNVETENGYTLQSVNGESVSGHFKHEVSVPFGENLDIVVSDSSGVIQLRDSVPWKKQFRFEVSKHMKAKELRCHNGVATFWLFRVDNPEMRKKISGSRFAKLPVQDMDAYRVSVVWDSGHNRDFSLEDFMETRKPIEIGAAHQITGGNRPSKTELFAGTWTPAVR